MKQLTIYKIILATCLKALVICIFLLVIFNEANLAVGHINDQSSADIINPDKNLNLFLEVVKYNEALDNYKRSRNSTSDDDESGSFDEFQKSYIPANNREVYWTVTESGFYYCSTNCLQVQKNLRRASQSNSNKPHLYNHISDYKQRLTEMFKYDLFGNTLNQTFSLKETLEDPTRHNERKFGSLTRPKSDRVNAYQQSRKAHTKSEQLKCAPVANETQYDFLKGIKRRRKLKGIAEPELITIFDRTGQIDMDALRTKIIKMKKKKLNGVKLYNRIGNFYRIIGNAHQSIECFRKALVIEPHNSDVLINLARLLLKLKFYDDAIFLTRKSLEYIRSDRSPWLQHYTLGEILKTNGYLDEAELHIEYTLKLKPNYSNGVKLLKEIKQLQEFYQSKQSLYKEDSDNQPYIFYITPTIYIRVTFNMIMAILFLIAAILCGLLGVIFDEDEKAEDTNTMKNVKTCNKMKELKNFTNNGVKNKRL